jgi:hypothetical protein
MTLASLCARLFAPLEWTSAKIKARPKGALVMWAGSLVVVALVL